MKIPYRILSLSAATALAVSTAAIALPTRGHLLPRSAARDVGALNAAQRISVTVHLKRPNEALFAKTVDALYDRRSPTFHHWLTDAQMAQFAPPVAQVAAVRAELARNGLSILSIAADRSSIRAAGTVAAVSQAFHTPIHQFRLNGTEFRANTAPATLSGVAGSYVKLVSGLESRTVTNMLARAVNVKTRQPLATIPLTKALAAGGLSSLITDEIVGPKQTFNYTTHGGLPTATYTGLTYNPTPALVPDYTPKQLQDITGMTAAYKQGLNGAGQTIVLLEAFGYPNAMADGNAFANVTGLPALNSSNFSVVYPDGAPPNPNAGYLTGWSTEIALDIDWAHAIAPGANIVVVASHGQDGEDFQSAMQYIIDNHVGNVVSDSWEEDTDAFAGPAEQESYEDILIAAAARGISFQFSTGDSGDGFTGSPIGAAGVPSVAPHATAVGGTSIGNVPGTNAFVNVGWGTVFSVTVGGNAPIQPGSFLISTGGGGGGSSVFWPKPAWQAALPGYYRQTPDVSALANPYTGVPIVVSDQTNTQFILVGVGGTSLASPIFTAMWAIANQKAGHSLGQASPTVAALKTGIIDVLPLTAAFSGAYTDTTGTTKYTANQLFANFVKFNNFTKQNLLAAIYDQPQYQQSAAITFDFDTSLSVTPGWDNATGYGTPHGLEFINAAASY